MAKSWISEFYANSNFWSTAIKKWYKCLYFPWVVITCRNIIGSEISFPIVPTPEKDLSKLVAALHHTVLSWKKEKLHFTALHLTALPHTSLHCCTPQSSALHLILLHYTSMYCSTPHELQYTPMYCSTPQWTAVHLNELQYTSMFCSTPQCTAVHLNVLQYTSLFCNTPHSKALTIILLI